MKELKADVKKQIATEAITGIPWNPVKELKGASLILARRSASFGVESGEGIERYQWIEVPPPPTRFMWNPVKELKVPSQRRP